jgi:succinate-semialdehyde dehydrogenase/glutarate-semialdehyde dehydrogenase
LESINPATGQLIADYEEHSSGQVSAIIDKAHESFLSWRGWPFGERARILENVADELESNTEQLARLMADEMGKPIGGGRGEVEKCAWVCRYYAENAENFLSDVHIETDRSKSYVHHEPLGPILAVMPWNFPLWQVMRFAAPALMAGNTGLLKHASNVTGCALAIEEIFTEAGLPDGYFSTLVIPGSRVAEVIEHPRVAAVTLTGSESAGRAVAAKAGEMLKKTVLELGGSDPSIILADADLDTAAASCATGRLINSGQSCIAAKRFIVHEAVHDEWLAKFTERMSSAPLGNPLDDSTVIGPMARTDLRDELHDQVQRSVESGARIHLGGEMPDSEGAFYPATILTGVGPGMPAYDEELFGPVAAVIEVGSEEEAISVANDSRFGLGAAVYTEDVERGEELAARFVDAGSVFVNAIVASDPRLPFGGIKASGYGRELSELGIKEFVNAKTVVVA